MKASEISIDEMIEKIDWTELHKLKELTNGYNQPIIIWVDGTMTLYSCGSWPNTDQYFLRSATTGWGNVDVSSYAEGWANPEKDEYENDTGNWINQDTGEIMTSEEMVEECIQDGEWDEVYGFWEEQLREQYMYDVLNGV